MKKLSKYFIYSILLVLNSGCEDSVNENQSTNDGGNDLPTGSPIIEGKNVYISGFYQDSSLTQMVACFWVNGARVDIEYGAAEAITVDNGDVYLAGQWFDSTGWNGEACYWINGVRYGLEGGGHPDTEVTGIAVDNGDVYVSGVMSDGSMFGTNACYWKNGVRTDLTDTSMDGMANSIGINNGDVYVTGWRIKNHASIACYWKNGNRNELHDTHSFGDAYDIAFKGNNVYIAGEIDPQNTDNWNACYWRNGNKVTLPRSGFGATAFGIFLDGNDIYLGGYTTGSLFTYDIGCKWTNGNLHQLSSSVAETDQTWLYDIAVADGVKITVGFYYPVIHDYNDPLYYNSPIFPCYYRNGQRVNLENADWQLGEATGVFIE